MGNKVGRPANYDNDAKVSIHARGKTRLQSASDRRAIIDYLVDNGGVMTLGSLIAHYKFDVRPAVLALERAGWVDITPKK